MVRTNKDSRSGRHAAGVVAAGPSTDAELVRTVANYSSGIRPLSRGAPASDSAEIEPTSESTTSPRGGAIAASADPRGSGRGDRVAEVAAQSGGARSWRSGRCSRPRLRRAMTPELRGAGGAAARATKTKDGEIRTIRRRRLIGVGTVPRAPAVILEIRCKSNPTCSSTAAPRRRSSFTRGPRRRGPDADALQGQPRASGEPEPRAMADKVMHAAFASATHGHGLRRMCQGQPSFQGFALSLTAPTTPRPSACSPPSATAGRCRCR